MMHKQFLWSPKLEHVDDIYVLYYIKDTTKAVTEAQDALNVIEDCLKDDYKKYKVYFSDQVYKIQSRKSNAGVTKD